MLKKLLKFYRLSSKEQFLIVEAIILTGASRASIILLPFRKLSSFIGKGMTETSFVENEAACIKAKKVGWAVALVSLNTPWRSNCFVQALTALIMLKRRRISSTLYLGVIKGKENKLIAHAWLRAGSHIITGEVGHKLFRTVAYFSSEFGGHS